MKYFSEDNFDIEGYQNSLLSLKEVLNQETFDFIQINSFHDGYLLDITVDNPCIEAEEVKESRVSVSARINHIDGNVYKLFWGNVSVYSLDFNIARNKIVETKQILFERGLDEWAYDELTLTNDRKLRHEIELFSKTSIIIECKNFSIKLVNA